MGLFNLLKSGGTMDEIRCDETSYLIWKWHPKGTQSGNNDKENAIRFGSSLRVKDGEVAVFVYDQKNGILQDYIEGPCDLVLETNNLPVLASITGIAYDGGSPYQAEVYFINLAKIIQVNFAVPFFDVYDPKYPEFGVPTAVRGTITFKITDYQEFIQLHRLHNFSLEEFQNQIKSALSRYVKDIIANAPVTHDIPLVHVESKIAPITNEIEQVISKRLKESFGVTVSNVDIDAIELDKSSDGYAQLVSVTRNMTAATIKAQTEANIKNIQDKQRIDSENYQETLRIQREEGQYAQHIQTQTSNFATYKVEAQTQVGVAGAEALGKMGSSNVGTNGQNDTAGINPTNMMAGMAVGGAIGQNIAQAINKTMNANASNTVPGAVPPPIINDVYHIVLNGKSTGPYDLVTLKQMIMEGTLTMETLVWKQGMTDWVKAKTISELNDMFK